MKLYPKTAAIVALLLIAALSIVLTTRLLIPHTAPLAIVTEHDGLLEVRTQVVDNTNRLRVESGLRPLTMAWRLNRGSQEHSDWMARTHNFVHSDDLRFQMNRAYDGTWSYAGENIGVFGGALSELLTSLRQSPDHRENMLKPEYRRIGVGATWDSEGDRMWLTVWFEG